MSKKYRGGGREIQCRSIGGGASAKGALSLNAGDPRRHLDNLPRCLAPEKANCVFLATL